MNDRLHVARERELITPADAHLARHLLSIERQPPAFLDLLIALTSARVRDGHVCLSIRSDPALEELNIAPDLETLRACPLVGTPGETGRPLILEDTRLYLARYHAWERQVIRTVGKLLEGKPPLFDEKLLRQDLETIFGGNPPGETDWQQVAAALAVTRRLCIISGGPGTGKTWTLARILKLLRRQPGGETLRIALAAPTGKAAARMTESIHAADPELLDEDGEARTLHRLLGMRPGRIQPRYGEDNPLPVDLLIVDEVSMVDLPMMARLLGALPEHARLILLGDRHQLASVEAGQVMADLCGEGGQVYSRETTKTVRDLTGIRLPASSDPQPKMADHLVELRRSRRFDPERGIGRLAAVVKAGDPAGLPPVLEAESEEIEWRFADGETLRDLVQEQVVPLFRAIRETGNPAVALAHLEDVRLLCAVREGPQGVRHLNRLVERALGVGGQGLYHGQPVMVTVNDYEQSLFNGDIGLVLRDDRGRLRVWFPRGADRMRQVLPSRLPAHETVYAMTIHKSQGSEFDKVLLVLPEQESPVVTRELLYTGITRARRKVVLCAGIETLQQALERRVHRESGLYLALWNAPY